MWGQRGYYASSRLPPDARSHNQRTTSFRHPVTGQVSPENTEYTLQDKGTGRVHSFGKRDQAIKRNLNVPVVVRGWLYKQDSSGMRLWKRKWFVLSDYCLFYYKDSREETVLGSIPLPSYVIVPVEPDDHISRKYAFKASHTGMRSYIYNRSSVIGSQAEHCGMRTYFFSADTQEDLSGWVRAMNQAALMQTHVIKREVERPEKSVQQAVPQTNHVNSVAKSSAHSESFHRPDREEPPDVAIRLAQRQEERYTLDVPGRPSEAEVELLSPDSAPGPSHRNGQPPAAHVAPPPEQNGGVAYKRGVVPRTDTEKQVQRKTALAQVEHWVKVQKGDPKSHPTVEYSLPRRTPPPQPKAGAASPYPSLPKTRRGSSPSPPTPRDLPSDYKYAHDRLSHFRMSSDERVASREGMVWQLYEWQQRQQFRHGSPNATPNFLDMDAAATAGSAFRVTVEMPRSVSVPPSPCEAPPPHHHRRSPFEPLSPRRPHTPSDRVTVRPLGGEAALAAAVGGSTGSGSPRQACSSRLSQTPQMDGRTLPTVGYITHTVSAPSLHGKTPDELTLLLIQLRRHQAKMAAGMHCDTPAQLQHHLYNGLLGHSLQADDTYIQLKKDLDYLDLKVTGREVLRDRQARPVKIAESDADVKLSRLCEQDKILQELEGRIRTLKEDKDKLEAVLDVSHQQMEQYQDQPVHAEKIAYQQRLLQEDVVHIRAEISQVSTEMENAWGEYSSLERDVDWLRSALQSQMNRTGITQQEKAELRRELWRVEDVTAGLSSSKANYQVTISSVTHPERRLVPSPPGATPFLSGSQSLGEMMALSRGLGHAHGSPQPSPSSPALASAGPAPGPAPGTALRWAEEAAPPRPPLPQLYSPEQDAPAVPPLPRETTVTRETTVIRHMSVRGLKRQSDERKRDREVGQYSNGDNKVEVRPFLSEPELLGVGGASGYIDTAALGHDGGYQTLPSRGPAGSAARLNLSTDISSYVTLRRGAAAASALKGRQSALERLYSGEPQPRGRMSAEEQLERMKRQQKALVRQRKRTLSQGDRRDGHAPNSAPSSSSSPRPLSADLGSWRREQEFDLALLERAVQGEEARGAVQGEERPAEHGEKPRSHSDGWLTFCAVATPTPAREADLEPLDYDLDLSKELSKPQKVYIPERYIDSEPEELLSPQEIEERHRKVERIKSILAKSSVQNLAPPVVVVDQPEMLDLDSALQQQERIITMSYALASEASLKSRQVAAKAVSGH